MQFESFERALPATATSVLDSNVTEDFITVRDQLIGKQVTPTEPPGQRVKTGKNNGWTK